MADQDKIFTELATLRKHLAESEARHRQAHSEAQQLRERINGIAQCMSEGVVVENAEGYFTFVNRAAASLLDYTVEEMTGMHWTTVFPPDQWPIVQAANVRRVRGHSDRYKAELLGKQGNRLTVVVSSGPQFNVNTGQFLGVLSVLSDITARRQAETNLRESEHFSRTIIENLPLGLSVRSRTGRLLYYNEKWKQIWAMPDEVIQADLARERTGLSFDTRDGYLSAYQDELRRVYESGGSLHLPELHPTRARPGAAKWIAQHFFGIKDDRGHVDRVVVLTEDITARKEMEDALRQSETKFRALFENSPDGILLLDTLDRTILDCNSAACAMNGYTREELVGQSIDLLHLMPTSEQEKTTYVETLRQGIHKYETLHRRKDGSVFPVEVSTSIVTLAGREVTLGIDRDITERKRVEQALAQRARELTALYETSLEINSQPDLDMLLRAIVERVADLLDARMCGLSLLTSDGDGVKLQVSLNYPAHYIGTILRHGEGLAGRVLQTGQPLIVQDYSHWEGRASAYANSGMGRVLGVPLKVNDKVIGVLNAADDTRTDVFTQEQVRLASLLADQAALAIEKARLLAQAQQQVERMKALNEIGQALAATLGLRQLYQIIYEQTCRVLKVDAFYIALFDESRGKVHFPLLYDTGIRLEPSTVPLGHGPTSHVIRTKTSFLVSHSGNAIQEGERFFGDLDRPSASALHVPMLIGQRVVGVVSAQNYEANAYGLEDQQVLEVIANQAAIAIENARLYQIQREEREMAEILSETGALMAASLDIGSVLDRILQQIGRVVPNDAADIMLVEGDQVRIARWRGYDRFGTSDFAATFAVPIVELYGLTKMIATAEPIFVADTLAEPRWVRFPVTRWVRSHASAPLRVRGRVLGFLNVNSAAPGQFGQAEADRLGAFANQAALSLANARLFQAEQEQRELAETLRVTGATLTSTLEADAILERLLDQLGGVVPNDLALVMLIEGDMARVVKGRGLAEHGITESTNSLQLAVRETPNLHQMVETRQPIVIPDVRDWPGWVENSQTTWIRSHVGAPIRIKNQVTGFLNLYSAMPRFFAERHAARLQILADQVGLALENARLYQAEREQFRRWQESQAQLVQAEKMAALGRLVGSISHEFNNPLQAVMGALELCKEEMEGRAQRAQVARYLGVMEQEIERIAAIVRRVRDFYRPVRREKRHADLSAVVHQVLELVQEQVTEHNIVVEQDLAPHLAGAPAAPPLDIDPDDLRQVLLTLALNAIEAMESGGTLRLRAEMDQLQPAGGEPQPAARIEISDTGVGIPPDILPHIFEPFVTTQADRATPAASRVALGLSISYGIVQAHGGEITVSSCVGAGTTFAILLPIGHS